MWIKIISKKKYDAMLQELEELRGAHLNLHELHKGLYQKSLTEKNELSDAMKQRDQEISDLQKKLRKSEHEKNEACKKLRKLEAKKS